MVEPVTGIPEPVDSSPALSVEELAARVAATTPARIFTGRAGTSYRTATALRLRADHAVARDAVAAELDTSPAALQRLTGGRDAIVLETRAASKAEYLRRPDLGRRLSDDSLSRLATLRRGCDLQFVLGDGLSARALAEQAPLLLDHLFDGATARGWTVGDLAVVRHCRVGILNDVGATLEPDVVVLLIGERPGLATASSLSAYLAYRPRPGDTDGQRNLVANIHSRGLSAPVAAARVLALAAAIRAAGASGVGVKEPPPALPASPGERSLLW